jgi:hypothetical protein
MKRVRTVTSHEFQRRFGDLANALKPGERITVTKQVQSLGFFIRAAKRNQALDNLANVDKLSYSTKTGQEQINEICG